MQRVCLNQYTRNTFMTTPAETIRTASLKHTHTHTLYNTLKVIPSEDTSCSENVKISEIYICFISTDRMTIWQYGHSISTYETEVLFLHHIWAPQGAATSFHSSLTKSRKSWTHDMSHASATAVSFVHDVTNLITTAAHGRILQLSNTNFQHTKC